MQDIETGKNTSSSNYDQKSQEKFADARKRGMVYCNLCQVETESDAYHCDECDVCIEDYDHHCVFFSKCIGGGNLYAFWGTIGGILFNFVNIAMMLLYTAIVHGNLHTNGSHK